MPTNFPTSLDSLTNPAGTDDVSVVDHAAQHSNANDAIEALEAKVGINSSAVTSSLDYLLKNASSSNPGHRHTTAHITGLATVATTGAYSDLSGTPTIPSQVFNTIAVSGQSNVVADSTSDTLTLVAGSGVTITTDAATDSITIAAKTQTFAIIGKIGTVADQDYDLAIEVPFGGTIVNTTTKSTAGTCTATFKVNTTALGGTANSVSTTQDKQAHASSNTFSSGDDIRVTISSNSSCANISFTIEYTRSLS